MTYDRPEDQITDIKQELLHRLDKVNEDFKQEILDHSREKQFNRDIQIRELQLQEEIRSMKGMMVCHLRRHITYCSC